jgi:hypothetical protein
VQTKLLLITLLILSSCSSYEGYIGVALQRAGVSRNAAECAADRLADRLSPQQLRSLLQAVQELEPAARKSMQEIERKVLAIGDPEVVAAAEQASASCVLVG